MTKQPEALRLADALEDDLEDYGGQSLPRCAQDIADDAAAELRRLHAECDQLLGALKAVSETAVYVGSFECSVSMEVVRRVDAAIAAAEGEKT